MTAPRSPELAVTGIGVALPWTADPAGAAPPPSAPPPADWFDTAALLGPRGYRYLPDSGRYLLLATRRAVAGRGGLDEVPGEDRGLALATNAGLTATLDAMDDEVVSGSAAGLSPATAPFFAVNVLANRPATEQRAHGFSLTFTSPLVAGIEALATGARALATGRCTVLLAGAVEQPPPGTGPAAPEQGAVALLLEPATAPAGRGRTRCRSRTLFVPPDPATVHGLLAAAIDDVTGGTRPPAHAVVDDSPVGEAVLDAVRHACDGGPVTVVPAGNGCLAPMLTLTRLAATGTGDHLVVAATAAGNVAVAALTAAPSRGGTP